MESQPPPSGGHYREGINASVSDALVKLYKENLGRGPTKARTEFAGPDTLVCTLQDSLTVAERNLIAIREHERVRHVRTLFRNASADAFRAHIEAITGRTVWAFVSGIDIGEDVVTEVFHLVPEEERGESGWPEESMR